jgi:hypothetical protein
MQSHIYDAIEAIRLPSLGRPIRGQAKAWGMVCLERVQTLEAHFLGNCLAQIVGNQERPDY